MANTVNISPTLPVPISINLDNLPDYITTLVQQLTIELSNHAQRLNTAMIAKDKNELPKFPEFLKAALPSAVVNKSAMVMVTDEVGGYTAAFSDGTNWRRVQDRVIVS